MGNQRAHNQHANDDVYSMMRKIVTKKHAPGAIKNLNLIFQPLSFEIFKWLTKKHGTKRKKTEYSCVLKNLTQNGFGGCKSGQWNEHKQMAYFWCIWKWTNSQREIHFRCTRIALSLGVFKLQRTQLFIIHSVVYFLPSFPGIKNGKWISVSFVDFGRFFECTFRSLIKWSFKVIVWITARMQYCCEWNNFQYKHFPQFDEEFGPSCKNGTSRIKSFSLELKKSLNSLPLSYNFEIFDTKRERSENFSNNISLVKVIEFLHLLTYCYIVCAVMAHDTQWATCE